jgi:DNA polymerase III alpha subunit
MTDSPSFIHLRVHSAYSLKEGALHVKKLPGLCEKLGFPAIAVTDTNNLFGGLEFSENCAKAGVQPIMGLQLAVAYAESAPGEKPVEPAPIALYAQDEAGWLNLMALSSGAFLDTDTTQLPHVTLETLSAHSQVREGRLASYFRPTAARRPRRWRNVSQASSRIASTSRFSVTAAAAPCARPRRKPPSPA